jgi:sugar phosphate isomerase/epimerase
MFNRRKFIQASGVMALGSVIAAKSSIAKPFSTPPPSVPAGLQLYTLGTKMDTDTDATLKRLAEIGYTQLESAFSRKGGYYGLKPKEFADKVKSFGLTWRSHHVGGAPFKLPAGAKPPVGPDGKPMTFPAMKNLRDNFQEVVDEVSQAGITYLVCSSTPIDTLDDINKSIETLSKTAEACKKAGITFAYHNHTKEFDRIEGQVPYEMFLTQISADLMKMELDLGWATKSGADPVELFSKNPGRFPLWHVKDLNRVTQKPVEIGEGYVDLKRVFDAAQSAGLQYYFVEQDGAPDPLENVSKSYKNIQKMLG